MHCHNTGKHLAPRATIRHIDYVHYLLCFDTDECTNFLDVKIFRIMRTRLLSGFIRGVPILHVDAGHTVALLMQQQRGHRRIHATGHADDDMWFGLQCIDAGNALDVRELPTPKGDRPADQVARHRFQ